MKAEAARGVALLYVLFLLFLFSSLVMAFLDLANWNLTAGSRRNAQAEARAAAYSGIQFLLQLLRQDQTPEDSNADIWARFAGVEEALAGRTVHLAIVDEGSKINLNEATSALLAHLPGFADPERREAFLDWRDTDHDPRSAGAEKDYYAALSPPYPCRDGLLDRLVELRLVKGWGKVEEKTLANVTVTGKLNINLMSYEAFDALLIGMGVDPFVVQSLVNDWLAYKQVKKGQPWPDLETFRQSLPRLAEDLWQRMVPLLTAEGKINVNTAPRPVLEALGEEYAGVGSQWAEAVIAMRREAPLTSLEPVLALLPEEKRGLMRLLLTTRSLYFSLTAIGETRGSRWRIRAQVERVANPEGDLPWRVRVLSWQEDSGAGSQKETSVGKETGAD